MKNVSSDLLKRPNGLTKTTYKLLCCNLSIYQVWITIYLPFHQLRQMNICVMFFFKSKQEKLANKPNQLNNLNCWCFWNFLRTTLFVYREIQGQKRLPRLRQKIIQEVSRHICQGFYCFACSVNEPQNFWYIFRINVRKEVYWIPYF